MNADVVAIRRLRAAAVLPQCLALLCVVVSLLFYTLDDNAAVAAWLLSAAAGFVYVARSLERGHGWALWLLTPLVLALTVASVGAFFAEDAPALERAQFAAGAARSFGAMAVAPGALSSLSMIPGPPPSSGPH